MSLKDRIANDINRCFTRQDQFGSTHYWNGEEIICVTDEEEALKRKNNNVNDISWDNNTREILIHTSLADFPGGREPEPNMLIVFDKRQMRVLEVNNNMGMLDIRMKAYDPRELM